MLEKWQNLNAQMLKRVTRNGERRVKNSKSRKRVGEGWREKAPSFFATLFFFTTLFFLCVVHIILKPGTSNEFQCGHIADTCRNSSAVLVLVRVHTGWFIFSCPLPALWLWFERSLVNCFLYFSTDLLDPSCCFLSLYTFNLQTTRSTAAWGKQRYRPCHWRKKDKTLFFYFCFQDFVAEFAAIADSCRSYFSLAGLRARVKSNLTYRRF